MLYRTSNILYRTSDILYRTSDILYKTSYRTSLYMKCSLFGKHYNHDNYTTLILQPDILYNISDVLYNISDVLYNYIGRPI